MCHNGPCLFSVITKTSVPFLKLLYFWLSSRLSPHCPTMSDTDSLLSGAFIWTTVYINVWWGNHLDLTLCPFGQDPQLKTKGEGTSVDRPINQELALPHDSPPFSPQQTNTSMLICQAPSPSIPQRYLWECPCVLWINKLEWDRLLGCIFVSFKRAICNICLFIYIF